MTNKLHDQKKDYVKSLGKNSIFNFTLMRNFVEIALKRLGFHCLKVSKSVAQELNGKRISPVFVQQFLNNTESHYIDIKNLPVEERLAIISYLLSADKPDPKLLYGLPLLDLQNGKLGVLDSKESDNTYYLPVIPAVKQLIPHYHGLINDDSNFSWKKLESHKKHFNIESITPEIIKENMNSDWFFQDKVHIRDRQFAPPEDVIKLIFEVYQHIPKSMKILNDIPVFSIEGDYLVSLEYIK